MKRTHFCNLLGLIVFASILNVGLVPKAEANTPNPTSVTIVGNLDTSLGCAGDWDPSCAAPQLVFNANGDVWQKSLTIPGGNYQYKAALNNGWAENYGLNAAPGGANIPLVLGASTPVKFYYDHKSHWVTDNHNSIIVTAPGSYQTQLGCSGDWDPSCMRSWLEDPDGNGIYEFLTTALNAGFYETKATINESWAENYGLGGVPGGANIGFNVPIDHAQMLFSYNPATHIMTIGAETSAVPEPGTIALLGLGLAGLVVVRRRKQ